MRLERRITREDIKKFCESIGDNNPLHYDEEYAKKKGFGGIIVPGMYLFSLAYYTIPIDYHYGIDDEFKFKRAIIEGDTVYINHSITGGILKRDFLDKDDRLLATSHGIIKEKKETHIYATKDLDGFSIYDKIIKEEDLRKFFESLGEPRDQFISTTEVPLIYLACLINPALLELSKGEGLYTWPRKYRFLIIEFRSTRL